MIALTRHFGLLWVAMEATTLATAPLIYDPADRRSLEAVWKYLMVCSVGIAVALLGIFFLATAQVAGGAAAGRALMLDDLLAAAPRLHPAWLRGSFVFVLIGFGTKMGLAPMHTWLPDAHGEAPSPISALLSGALLNLRVPGDPARAGGAARGGPGRTSPGRCWWASACSRWRWRRRSCSASATTSACWPTRASSTWASSRWAPGSAGVAAFGALLHVLSRLARQGAALPARGQRAAGHGHQAHARDHRAWRAACR